MRSVRVSVIMPTYNRLPFLDEAVKSCTRQSYRHTELVVVDDGSTDGTPDYLKDLQGRLSREHFQYVRQRNRGPAAARNAGLKAARGEYVRFLDSDDTLDPDAVERAVKVLTVTGADACIGARRFMSPSGKRWSVNYEPPKGHIVRPLSRFFDLELRPQGCLWTFRRHLFSEVAWDERLLAREDTDLLGRMLVRGMSVAGAPLSVYNQRYHKQGKQSSLQFRQDVLRSVFLSNQRLYKLMRQHGRLREAGRSFARSMSRTALRLWNRDREYAQKTYRLARKACDHPELVLLPSAGGPGVRALSYLLWAIGGLYLCGPLLRLRFRFNGIPLP